MGAGIATTPNNNSNPTVVPYGAPGPSSYTGPYTYNVPTGSLTPTISTVQTPQLGTASQVYSPIVEVRDTPTFGSGATNQTVSPAASGGIGDTFGTGNPPQEGQVQASGLPSGGMLGGGLQDAAIGSAGITLPGGEVTVPWVTIALVIGGLVLLRFFLKGKR